VLFDEVTKSNKNLSEFLAVLAHELRNPLAPIVTGLEVMRLRADSLETVASVRGIIERQVKQLAHLINDLLDIARVTNGKVDIRKEKVDLRSVVSNAVETSLPLIEKSGHAFSLELHDAPLAGGRGRGAHRPGDRQPADECGEVHAQRRQHQAHRRAKDGEAVIAVTDSGMGIPGGIAGNGVRHVQPGRTQHASRPGRPGHRAVAGAPARQPARGHGRGDQRRRGQGQHLRGQASARPGGAPPEPAHNPAAAGQPRKPSASWSRTTMSTRP
jgi:hypothetical protein